MTQRSVCTLPWRPRVSFGITGGYHTGPTVSWSVSPKELKTTQLYLPFYWLLTRFKFVQILTIFDFASFSSSDRGSFGASPDLTVHENQGFSFQWKPIFGRLVKFRRSVWPSRQFNSAVGFLFIRPSGFGRMGQSLSESYVWASMSKIEVVSLDYFACLKSSV